MEWWHARFMFGTGMLHLAVVCFSFGSHDAFFAPHVKGLRVDQLIAPNLQFGE